MDICIEVKSGCDILPPGWIKFRQRTCVRSEYSHTGIRDITGSRQFVRM